MNQPSSPFTSVRTLAVLGVLALGLVGAFIVLSPTDTPTDAASDAGINAGTDQTGAPKQDATQDTAPDTAAQAAPERVSVPDPDTASGSYLAGHHAEATGDGRSALKWYATAIELGLPPSAEIYSRMYVLGLSEGRLDDALSALDKAEQLGAQPPLALLSRAVRAIRDGDFATAETLLKADESSITHILGPVLIAWSRVGRQDIPGALSALDNLTKSKDAEPSPLHLLHGALINDIAGNHSAAEQLFVQLRASSGLSVRTAELSGHHLERQGRAADARKIYQDLGTDAEAAILSENLDARLQAGSSPALDIDTAQKGAAEALYGIASAMLAQSAWDSTPVLAHMALALRPDFPSAVMVLAATLQQSNRRAEAIDLYRTLPAHSPYAWMARLQLADNLDREGQADEALALLRIMSEERPTMARPLIEWGDLLRRHDRFKEAADIYSVAIKRIGQPTEADWGLFYSRGVSYEQSDQWPLAEADFLKALELSPDQPSVLNYLGYLWIDKGQHLERALKMIATAVDKRPRDGAIVDSLGWGLYRTGDFAGAVKQLERAAMLNPADPVINDHLGDALWRVGRVREARFQWERALAMKPDAALAEAITQKLNNGLPALDPANP